MVLHGDRFNADKRLHAAGLGEAFKHFSPLADAPIRLREVPNVGRTKNLEKRVWIAPAGKGVVIGQFHSGVRIALGDRGQFISNAIQRLLAESSKKPAGSAKLASERTAALRLHCETRAYVVSQKIKARSWRISEVELATAAILLPQRARHRVMQHFVPHGFAISKNHSICNRFCFFRTSSRMQSAQNGHHAPRANPPHEFIRLIDRRRER